MERRHGRAGADPLPLARELDAQRHLARRPARVEEDEADGLLGCAPSRSGDAGDRDGDVDPESLARPCAIAAATSAETAPCSASSSAGTPSNRSLTSFVVRDDASAEDVARSGDLREPLRRRARRCTTRRSRASAPGAAQRPARAPGPTARRDRRDSRRAARRSAASSASARASAPGSTTMSTWISNSRAQIVTSTPSPSPPASASAFATADSLDAVEAERRGARPRRPREDALHRLGGERPRPQLAAARRGGPGSTTTTHEPVSRTTPGAVPAMPSETAPVGQGRLLAHAGCEVGVRPLVIRSAKRREICSISCSSSASSSSGSPGDTCDELYRPVVVRRTEAARDEADVGLEALAQRRLELVRVVADDRDARRAAGRGAAPPARRTGPFRSVRSPRTSSLPVTTIAARGRLKSSARNGRAGRSPAP